ncbi:hypothetical protein BDN72DRAFT_147157 [Pluteus cervinus]|uniref:Uncharacterized protein n=1 Tax=Pluteus cervinus TaxID=181527 RepID=A0ACD3ALS1_9AGAR|nr:hypothetical protein BDN72DRAFT_147157 [Pluteus cervinus]
MEQEIRGQVFRLLDLPSELIDNILGHVPLHRDLLNFASASRLCSSVVIPRHTEYRVVHFEDDDTDAIWTHLARRSDLASNIREIQVIYDEAPNEFLSGTAHIHIPHGLFDMDLDFESETAEEFQQDILNVLGAMTRLEKVHWNWVPKRSKHLVQKVFDVLKTIPTLKHLSFNHPKKFSPDVTLEKHPNPSPFRDPLGGICLG